MSPKVLLVGFDGATFDIIRPLVADGRLPTLAHMMETGAHGILRSNIPPITPSAWTSIFTGKNPGKHGIYDFAEIEPQTYQFRTIRTDNHGEKTIWQLLGEAGKRSIVLDVPFTYPPQPLHGLMITGYGTPRQPNTIFTYPANLVDQLPFALRSEVRVALPSHRFDRSQQFIDEWHEVMAGRRQLLHHLIENEKWDFFMVVFSITDNMAHVFWTYVDPAHPNYYREEGEKYRQAFRYSYEICDQLLGEVMEKTGAGTTTMVVSDHGFGSVRPRQYIFQRLLEGGYITLKQGNGRVPFKAKMMHMAVTTYNRFPILREWVKGLRPQNLASLKKTLTQSGIMPSEKSIDHTRSKVIPSNFGLHLWVNEEKRFASGLVKKDEKEALLTELSQFLLADQDKVTYGSIITHAYRGETLYHGPLVHLAPDLIIEYNNLYRSDAENPPHNPYVEGGHTIDGVFLAYGPGIAPGPVSGTRLIDLAPTILHLLNQPIPPDMDGRVLTNIFTPELAKRPISIGLVPAHAGPSQAPPDNNYSIEEEEEVKEQLRQLGYID